MKLRGRIGALQWPRVTDVEETGCSGQSGLLCPDDAGRPLGRGDQSVAFPLPEIFDFRGGLTKALGSGHSLFFNALTFEPLGLYLNLPAGEGSDHRGQEPYGGVQASPCDPGQVPPKPSCAPSSTSSSCCQTKS